MPRKAKIDNDSTVKTVVDIFSQPTNQTDKGFKFCVYCGEKLQMPEDFCPECVKTYSDYYSFCPECGTKLVDETLPEYCEIRKNKA